MSSEEHSHWVDYHVRIIPEVMEISPGAGSRIIPEYFAIFDILITHNSSPKYIL